MNGTLRQRLFEGGIATAISSIMLVAFVGFAAAAPGGTRPGWGCGDTNHVHTGPPGLGAGAVSPCGAHGVSTAAVQFVVSAPTGATAGSPFSFTVAAVNRGGNTLTGFADTIHFVSTDTAAGVSLPADAMLTNGTGTFSATLVTAGNQTITVTDTSNGDFTGTSSTIAVSGAATTHVAVAAPVAATHGTAFNFTVTAQDQFNNTASGYGGTLHFTSSDGAASLPADAMLTNGSGTFSATLNTIGTQTVSATDTTNSSITGMSNPIVVS